MTREYLQEIEVNGLMIRPGADLIISDEPGRFGYINATYTSAGRLVLNVLGGRNGYENFRSFYAERVFAVCDPIEEQKDEDMLDRLLDRLAHQEIK